MSRIEDDDIRRVVNLPINNSAYIMVDNMLPKTFKKMSYDNWCVFKHDKAFGFLIKKGMCIGVYDSINLNAYFYSGFPMAV